MEINTKYNLGQKCFIQSDDGQIMESEIIEIDIKSYLRNTCIENNVAHIRYMVKGWIGEFNREESRVFMTKNDLIESL